MNHFILFYAMITRQEFSIASILFYSNHVKLEQNDVSHKHKKNEVLSQQFHLRKQTNGYSISKIIQLFSFFSFHLIYSSIYCLLS